MKTFLQLVIGVAVCVAVAVLLRIDPQTEYGWFMGAVHGFLLVPNFIVSLFDGSWLVKAPLHTQMYNIDWWVCGVIDVIYWIWAVAGAVLAMIKGR